MLLTPAVVELGGDPLTPMRQLGHWLVGQATMWPAGVLAGAALARAMRAARLHWTWTLPALALVVLSHRALGGAGEMIAIASAWAALRGRRWHREDVESGGDLRAAADSLRTPLDAATSAVRAAGSALLARARAHPAGSPATGGLLLGHDERGRRVTIPVGEGRHGLVVGATGSGKTVTQTSIAAHAIAAGSAAIVVDPKGDASMRAGMRAAARLAGRRFVHWSPAGGCIYNPYSRGSDTEIADKLLGGERFTEPHYLRQAQRYIGHAVRALQAVGIEVSLSAVVEQLEPSRLEVLARDLPEPQAGATHAYLDALTPRQRADLAGVRDRLAVLAESDVGRWLDPGTDGAQRIELLSMIRAGAVVYFSLEADRRPLLTQMLGAAIVQDLLTTVAALQSHPVPALVVIDEFSAVSAREVVRLFGRARSAGLSLLVGTQELSDLRPPGGERLLEQVIGNLSLIVAHRQLVPASAELIAGLAGTRGTWRVSRHSDGRNTRTRTREKRLDPDQVMTLPRGWAALLELAGGHRGRLVRIQPSATCRRSGVAR